MVSSSTSFTFPLILLTPTEPFTHSFSSNHHNLVVQLETQKSPLTPLSLDSTTIIVSIWSLILTPHFPMVLPTLGRASVKCKASRGTAPGTRHSTASPAGFHRPPPASPASSPLSSSALWVLPRGSFSPFPKSGRCFNNTVLICDTHSCLEDPVYCSSLLHTS